MPAYLEELTLRLARQVALLPEPVRQRHADYLLARQQPEGGFAGRQGGSDLYYTSFAIRSLAMLGQLHGTVAEQVASFLRGRMGGQESIVDFLSFIYSAKLLEVSAGIDLFADTPTGWQDAVADSLETLRRDDGGYAKGHEGQASSTYHTFLVILCRQFIERPLPHPDQAATFVLSQQAEGGGFREIRASKRAGTNPTAAAVATLRILDELTPAAAELTLDFLVDMQTDEGGLRANTRIPIADLLSTFTGLQTLTDLQGVDQIDTAAVVQYAKSLELPEGGFHGAVWDEADDVEYTFYGLGTLALLTQGE